MNANKNDSRKRGNEAICFNPKDFNGKRRKITTQDIKNITVETDNIHTTNVSHGQSSKETTNDDFVAAKPESMKMQKPEQSSRDAISISSNTNDNITNDHDNSNSAVHTSEHVHVQCDEDDHACAQLQDA